jgi:hypothetical protein
MSETGNGTWNQYQKLVLHILEQHDEKLEALRKQLSETASDKVVISENINSLKEDVNFLLGVIRDGATMGITPILTRVDTIEGDIRSLKDLEAKRADEHKSLKDYKRALFISILGILASIGWSIIEKLVIMAGK